ncbi:proline-rich receptor-like protein kinase PERK8 [Humulus lupulus]|uniref:proline-rich receptor-like protein kinase PERK8 n=1 Tax=Humulus lupulus TaxID=3486 RepID=UPI002B413120|nr:proline-rich receptor-like protein kinase PERK8 [Humulus lupulus]
MEIRAASLANMTDIEKSVKDLVTENNLRLVGLLAPPQDVRETTAGSVIGGEAPEQNHDVSQPPKRRRTAGVTIREPSSTPRAAAAPAPLGKGKQKVSEDLELILESSDENDLFELYSEPVPAAPSSKKKWSRPHRGESSKNPPTKKAQTGDPPVPVPSWVTTPPLAPLDQTSPPAPVDQTPPPIPADQTPPPAPADQTPPDQTGDALTRIVLSLAKERMTKLSRHRHS